MPPKKPVPAKAPAARGRGAPAARGGPAGRGAAAGRGAPAGRGGPAKKGAAPAQGLFLILVNDFFKLIRIFVYYTQTLYLILFYRNSFCRHLYLIIIICHFKPVQIKEAQHIQECSF